MSILRKRDHDRAERVAIERPSTLRDHLRQPIDVVINDLSSTGFLLSTELNLKIGSTVSIGLPGLGSHQARVQRSDGKRYGCTFLTPITDAEVKTASVANTLVHAAFRTQITEADLIQDENAVRRLALPVRITVILGSSLALWLVIGAIIVAVLRIGL